MKWEQQRGNQVFWLVFFFVISQADLVERRHFIKRGMLSSAMSDSRSSPRLQAPLCHGLRNTRGFSLAFLQPSSSPQQRCEDLSRLPHVHSPPLWCFQGCNDGGLKFPTKFLQTPLGLSNPAAKSSLHAHTVCKCLSALLRDPGDSHIAETILSDFARGLQKKFALQHYPNLHP